MSNTVIADTGFWLALLHAGDRHHSRAVRLHQELAVEYVTTWPVVTETCHLLTHRLAPEAAVDFLDCALGDEPIAIRVPQHEANARLPLLMQRYLALPMDLADASLVLLAEELGHGRILSTDRRDFGAYRWKNRHPFENLMFPED